MPDPLFHTGDQHADALIAPIARSVILLTERAEQYATRLRMSDGDRELVEMAQRILTIAHEDLRDLLSNGSRGEGADA
ncbi:MAG: hypothetical protein WBW04_04105 [Nitrolancea sp.]